MKSVVASLKMAEEKLKKKKWLNTSQMMHEGTTKERKQRKVLSTLVKDIFIKQFISFIKMSSPLSCV